MMPGETDHHINYDQLVSGLNPVPILRLLGALQLSPANHGKNVLFEELERLAVLQKRNNGEKPNATWQQLKTAIEGYADRIYLEEEPTTAFTENIVFSEGNYTVYPGIYVSGSRTLNELLECIFLVRHDLTKKFLKLVSDAVGILLFMSNRVAEDAGHERFFFDPWERGNIVFPDYERTMELVDAICFPKDYLKQICGQRKYDHAILKEFVISADSEELDDDDPDNNYTNIKPLLDDGEEIILYMPTSVVSALTDFIFRKAEELKCYNPLMQLVLNRQFQKCTSAFKHMGWQETNMTLPEDGFNLPVREKVFRIDNQKFAYLCFIGKHNQETLEAPVVAFESYKERNDLVVNQLLKIIDEQPYDVLSLFIISEAGEDFMFAWPKSPKGHFSVALTYSELDGIAYSDNSYLNTLWKFAKIYNITSEKFRINAPGGTLDAYVAYLNNKGSFYNSEDKNPIGGVLFIEPGYSNDFLRQIQRQRDEHAALIFHEQKVGYNKVIRYKEYAPIYIEKEPLIDQENIFRLVIETYKMPVWIINRYSNKEDKEDWAKYLCEGIAFWLHKMKDHLQPVLEKLTLVQFEIEVIAESIHDVDPDPAVEETDQGIEDIELEIMIDVPRIQIIIPTSFINLVRRPDNYADKVLMKAVLDGIVKYVKEANDNIIITKEQIKEITDQVLQPSNAKMFLFNDASYKIRLDNRGLTSLRNIPEADVSFILDNLVSYLPADYKIPAVIENEKEKRKLCETIVSALINIIQKKIEQFDGENLIEWLIKINEKCIQVREYNEMIIPAKIACFSNFDKEVSMLMKKESDRVATGQAARTLIEFIATKMPQGKKWPNFDDTEEMLALVDQVISWGTLSDSIWTKLEDPAMGILPSGRIGTDKTFQNKVFVPYAQAKTTIDVFNYVDTWEKNYSDLPGKSDGTSEIEAELDFAFQMEFGISFKTLLQICWLLVGNGFTEGKGSIKVSEEWLYQTIRERTPGISNDDISITLNLLSLLERKSIGNPPEGFERFEIYPWRHKRLISYMLRPLIKINKGGSVFYIYGYRHLVDYIENLHYLLYTGKFPDPVSDELSSCLGKISSGKGNPFREMVMNWFKTETNFEVIPVELDIAPHGHLKADKNYGDIDLLVINHEAKIVYSIECKNISGAKTVYEMWSEINSYLGDDKNKDNAKIIKHLNRDRWLKEHKASLTKFVPGISEYEIKSLVMTADEIPLTYLKNHALPLPVKSFSFLRKEGISILDSL